MTQTTSTKIRFTTRTIDQLPACPADSASKALEFTDCDIPGLKVAVSKTGRKTFLQRYTFRGQKRAARIGEYPATSVIEARKAALEMRGLLDRGIDPQERKDLERESPTFEAFSLNDYLPFARQNKRSANDDASKLRLHLIPRFGRRRLCDISRRDIEIYISEVRQSLTPASANRHLAVLSAIFRRAVLWERAERNPCSGVPRYREDNIKQRFLSPDEIGRMFVAMDADPNKVAVAALRFLLLTGVRRQEALGARWESVQMEERLWHVPHTKAGRARYIQLNDAAINVLKSLPGPAHSPWVFAGRDPKKPINDPRKTLWRVLKAAKIDDHVRVHDLRHSFASLAVNAGQSLFLVQNLLGHASPAMTMRYSHLASVTLRDASQAVADVVTKAHSAEVQTRTDDGDEDDDIEEDMAA
jgi:integrase